VWRLFASIADKYQIGDVQRGGFRSRQGHSPYQNIEKQLLGVPHPVPRALMVIIVIKNIVNAAAV
jgi:hypothetical protein